MGFRQQVEAGRVKSNYNSAHDDILNGFFVPVLEESIHYYRMTGSYSSSVLSVAARGIESLIEKNGDMKLVVGAFVSNDDVEAIRNGIETPESATERFAELDFRSIRDGLVRDQLGALGWMIAKGFLEIRFALPVDEKGLPTGGLFHAKSGVFEDKEGDRIAFDGSDNESASAFKRNTERFKVFYGWLDAHKEFVEDDLTDFWNLWEGREPGVALFTIPNAVKQNLICIAPSTDEQLISLVGRLRDYSKRSRESFRSAQVSQKKARGLWPHQKTAIQKWEENGRVGILEMATGTGKTLTAIEGLARVMRDFGLIVAVIACPYDHLVKQWKKNIDEYGLAADIIVADSSNNKWKSQLNDKVLDLRKANLLSKEFKDESKHGLVVLTTHDSLSSENLISSIREAGVRLMLIVDEVHGIGAPQRKLGLIPDYSFRLGLSATPRRWFDDEGTKTIYDYFQKTVFEFSLWDAINTINPDTGESYLAPYYYRPRIVELTNEELEYYAQVCEKIEKTYFSSRSNPEMETYLESLYFERQRILNNAIGKYDVLKDTIDEQADFRHCIIYCAEQQSDLYPNTKQIDVVQDLLNVRNIKQHRFTGDEGTTESEEFGGVSEREHLLKLFADGTYRALVAMKCLDEGVDVPPARLAILMSSTSNPRQFIQRRGRILRRYQSKISATIYDLVVLPDLSGLSQDESFIRMEKKIISKEFERFREFSKDAINYVECLDMVNRLEQRINLGKPLTEKDESKR